MDSLYAIHCADGERRHMHIDATSLKAAEHWVRNTDPEDSPFHKDCGPHTVEEYRHLPRPLELGEELRIVQTYNEEWRKANPPKCDGSGRIVVKLAALDLDGVSLPSEVLSNTPCPGCPECAKGEPDA